MVSFTDEGYNHIEIIVICSFALLGIQKKNTSFWYTIQYLSLIDNVTYYVMTG